MLDFNSDGNLDALDLLSSFELISLDSKFGHELKLLMKWFTKINITDKSASKDV